MPQTPGLGSAGSGITPHAGALALSLEMTLIMDPVREPRVLR